MENEIMKNAIDNFRIDINGKTYKLVEAEDAKEKKEDKTIAIVSMETPLGEICKSYPLKDNEGNDVFGIGEGDYEFEGDTYHVRYCTPQEAETLVENSFKGYNLFMLVDMLLAELDE